MDNDEIGEEVDIPYRDVEGLAMEEIPPRYDLLPPPKTLTKSRRIDDVFWLAGRAPIEGQKQYDVMFVTTSVEEEEMSRAKTSLYGFTTTTPAEYLKGSTGVIKDVAMRAGIDLDACYYTAVVKWLLPKTQRTKPSKKVLKYGMPVLQDEIRRTKPKIIVCLGKHAFDMLAPRTMSFNDAHGSWQWSEEYDAYLYVMHAVYSFVTRPEMYETFRIDFDEISRQLKRINNEDDGFVPVNVTVLKTLPELKQWVDDRIADGSWLFSVDCEWHGNQHIDGQLRSTQFAWTPNDGVYIRFRDEQNQFAFDVPGDTEVEKYANVGKELQRLMNLPHVKYIGHHYSADSPWLERWLNLEVYQKCILDTEFAQQTIDEASELGLERGIAMRYTSMGFYNYDLLMWKRENKDLCEDGYGYIPDDIIIPYAVNDVIAVMRAYPKIVNLLKAQQLMEYYDTILNPFVTDVFHTFASNGLPMDRAKMDKMRILFHYARRRLEVKLQERIYREARETVVKSAINELHGTLGVMESVHVGQKLLNATSVEEALDVVKPHIDPSEVSVWVARIGHMLDAPGFNIRSADHLKRWLFDVEKLMPIKSTNQKAKGFPSMAWDKVLELPPDRRKQYSPACDKQTLQVLSTQHATINQLLDLNAVGNICKAFLKEADIIPGGELDGLEDEDEVSVKENGLHSWLTSDFDDGFPRIMPQMSLTETGRPRSWRPNTLNFPSYVNERISRSIGLVIEEDNKAGVLPQELMEWVGKAIQSIRSCITAPPDWCLVESDYKTAEMHGFFLC